MGKPQFGFWKYFACNVLTPLGGGGEGGEGLWTEFRNNMHFKGSQGSMKL